MPAPALVVEVVSNSQKDKRSRNCDYVRKRQEYAERGIAEYWIVDPEGAVVFILKLVDGVYQEQRFAGREVSITDVSLFSTYCCAGFDGEFVNCKSLIAESVVKRLKL